MQNFAGQLQANQPAAKAQAGKAVAEKLAKGKLIH